ncbi:DUF222 domain-containing protein [Gryllotalpicola reticulitermitis]|uniref:DUF222 domain-containing protein n=1 Tax=Gryllotalpicola reticulitermitis TaxID=1184153 RepID=A0ABV8QAN3_9MICO
MSIEIAFDQAAEQSAFALGASWQAEQFERVVAIRKEIARLEAEEVHVLSGLLAEAEGEAGEDAIDAADPADVTRRHDLAVRSIATELAASTHTSVNAAQSRLGEAWVLSNQLRATLTALEAGDISRAHAHELVTETDHLGGARFEAELALLPLAKALPISQFRRRAKRALETLEKDSLKARHARAFARRRVDVTAARDGMAHLDAYIDAADAALLRAGLQNAAAEARSLGDTRSATQLQADLFVDILSEGNVTIGAGAPLTASSSGATDELVSVSSGTLISRAPVTVDVLIPAAVLAGSNGSNGSSGSDSSNGSDGSDGSDQHSAADLAGAGDTPASAEIVGLGVIDPVRARQLVARAPSLRRILTDPISSAIVDFDRKTYRVPAELKRIIQRRDGHCRAPGCFLPVSVTELDHTRAAAGGGPTALWNLACLCRNHHHLKHEAGWGLKQYLGGILEWRSPSGRFYRTHPEVAVVGPPGQPVDPWRPPSTGQPAPFDLPDEIEDDGGGDPAGGGGPSGAGEPAGGRVPGGAGEPASAAEPGARGESHDED